MLLAVSLTLTAQQQVSEKEKSLANQVYKAQMSGSDSAFYQAEEMLMDFQKKQKNWERFYSAWLNRIIYEMNHKNFHRAFTEINLLTDDIRERGKAEFLYIPNQAMGLYYTSRTFPELSENYYRRALESIDTLKNTVATFNTYLSLAQAMSFNHPAEAMDCLDHLPKSMLDNPMYESGVLGYRCIIAHKQDDLDAFNHYFERYDSIRKNLPDQFNAANLYQVMVCHGLMHHDYQSALAWCDSIDVPLVATELRIDVYNAMHEWEKAYREQIIKDSLIHIDNRNALEDNLEDLTHDIELLQAEKEKAELRSQELWIITGLGIVIIAMLITMLIYRHRKNLRLKRQFQQLQEEQNRNAELRGIRRAIVGSLKQQLDSPVRVLQGYARIFNDPAFHLPVDERSKHYMDIANAAHSIEAMIEPVIGSYAHGGTGISKEQRIICQNALRSSLMTLTGVSEMIADDVNHQIPQEEYMLMRSEISQSAHHVASSVHELMELCLTDEKMKMEKNERVGLNEIVSATLSSYDARNHDLSFDFATDVDGGVNILTNQHALQEIINCLLANADRYATGGVVKLCCQSASDGTYSISITNDGPTISPEYAESIFDPFVRLSEDSQTLGLGLTLAHRLAESMDYVLTFDASYADGVRFTVTGIR
jgi:signal transduction histidine kinase